MGVLEALILGIIQGLTEFLPISSSGHLELGNVLLNIQEGDHLAFTIIVHAATVLSIIVVFWQDILVLLKDLFKFEWNPSTRYISKLLLSMLPIGVVGLLFKEEVEAFFSGNLLLVGSMLLITGGLLLTTHYIRTGNKEVSYGKALWVGVAQAFAVMPGISRSGATIVTALLSGVEKDRATRFSFLMVLLPVIGITLLKVTELSEQPIQGMSVTALSVGFIAAFVSGFIACKWMLYLVRRMKLVYFAIYCFVIGGVAITANWLV